MGNKWDLKTVLAIDSMGKAGTPSTVTNIGGAIASGKTRFLTYIRVERRTPLISDDTNLGMEAAVGSHTTAVDVSMTYASVAAADVARLILVSPDVSALSGYVGSEAVLRNEVRGDIEHPILSVAGPNYMVLGICSSATAMVFAEYFDE